MGSPKYVGIQPKVPKLWKPWIPNYSFPRTVHSGSLKSDRKWFILYLHKIQPDQLFGLNLRPEEISKNLLIMRYCLGHNKAKFQSSHRIWSRKKRMFPWRPKTLVLHISLFVTIARNPCGCLCPELQKEQKTKGLTEAELIQPPAYTAVLSWSCF